jgi:hypothetical protein
MCPDRPFDVGQGTDVIDIKVGTHQNQLTLAIALVRLAHGFRQIFEGLIAIEAVNRSASNDGTFHAVTVAILYGGDGCTTGIAIPRWAPSAQMTQSG